MELEIISRLPTQPEEPQTFLCVPGAWHTARCWHNFLGYFARHGYRAAALNLRGHGNSPGRQQLHQFSLADYGADIAAVVTHLTKQWGTSPILIGHSSGGWLVQKYLESHAAPAAVLLASLPPTGVRAVRNPFARRHPLRFFLALTGLAPGAMLANPRLLREAFFAPTTPLDEVAQSRQHLQVESRRMLLGLGSQVIDPTRIRTPLLVLGAEQDNFLPCEAVTVTAQAYGTEAHFIPAVGHALMVDVGWARVADRILAWVQA